MGDVKKELNSSAATADIESVKRVKTSQGVTYAEAVRKVGMQPNGGSVKMADMA